MKGKVLILILFFFLKLVDVVLVDEEAALCNIVQAIPELGTTYNWNCTNGNFCAWEGITCTNDHITKLILPTIQNKALIPEKIGDLRELVYLDFSNNIEGTIPTSLSTLTKLTYLSIYDSNLHGPIPTQLSLLTRLQHLCLIGDYQNYNKSELQGTIPNWIRSYPSLTFLSIAGISLSGTIPIYDLLQLSNLRTLSLSYLVATGTIPPELKHLTFLTILSLTNNDLTGTLPPQLQSLTALQTLKLGDNTKITGTLPPEYGKLNKLTMLWLASLKNIFGTIPPEYKNLTNLETLQMDYLPNLTGCFPNCWNANFSLECTLFEVPLNCSCTSTSENCYKNPTKHPNVPVSFGNCSELNITCSDQSEVSPPSELSAPSQLPNYFIIDHNIVLDPGHYSVVNIVIGSSGNLYLNPGVTLEIESNFNLSGNLIIHWNEQTASTPIIVNGCLHVLGNITIIFYKIESFSNFNKNFTIAKFGCISETIIIITNIKNYTMIETITSDSIIISFSNLAIVAESSENYVWAIGIVVVFIFLFLAILVMYRPELRQKVFPYRKRKSAKNYKK